MLTPAFISLRTLRASIWTAGSGVSGAGIASAGAWLSVADGVGSNSVRLPAGRALNNGCEGGVNATAFGDSVLPGLSGRPGAEKNAAITTAAETTPSRR